MSTGAQQTTQAALDTLAAAPSEGMEATPEWQEFRRIMRAEFDDWVETLRDTQGTPMYPDALEPGGLPTGWTPCAHVLTPSRNKWDNMVTAYLITRKAGGWAVMYHRVNPVVGGSSDTLIGDYEQSLRVLYNDIRHYAQGARSTSTNWVLIEEMMRSFIATQYDLDDPTEAAEATLVALGGPLRLLPRALP